MVSANLADRQVDNSEAVMELMVNLMDSVLEVKIGSQGMLSRITVFIVNLDDV